MKRLIVACLLAGLSVPHAEARAGQPPLFHDSAMLAPGDFDVRVAGAVQRGDGSSVTFGSRTDAKLTESLYLIARDAGGKRLAAHALPSNAGHQQIAQSLIALDGGDVVAASLEFDDFAGPYRLFLTRLDAGLNPVWNMRLNLPQASFASARLKAPETGGGPLRVLGEVQYAIEGGFGNGDGLLATVDPADGSVLSARTIGTAEQERTVDWQRAEDGSEVVLLETARRTSPVSLESGDALVRIGASGQILASRAIGHPASAGIRARALDLLPHPDGGWVIAGRRTAFGPNFFYLQRVAADFAPAPQRTLIPFFNVIASAAHGGSFWLYGEANGEAMHTGTVLMRLDADLALRSQRRYATDNIGFPTGALALAGDRALLALGANRSGDQVFVFETAHRVDLDAGGAGLVCDESAYAGFSTATDVPGEIAGWTPVLAALPDLAANPLPSLAEPLSAAGVGLCLLAEDAVFADGFELPLH
ncbi:MAG TPA: hypothetical protein VMR06_00680 [Dokdonella sp.]|uniref:hypothetical protein n=1 Tax=Dokdonella sp. TaxID=2291710 RepID=UPI002BEE2A78|nr:hypothetical protein [Dokdonella sp.]HUD40496.1 hypothetical protein [Dokdonella sp.]